MQRSPGAEGADSSPRGADADARDPDVSARGKDATPRRAVADPAPAGRSSRCAEHAAKVAETHPQAAERRVRACAIIAHAATAVRRRPFYRTAARDHGERVKSRSRAADPSHAGAADAAMEDRMGRDFYPRPEGEILSFTLNFSQKISVSPGAYGLSVLQCTHYAATYEAFAGQHTIASNPMTATRGARAAKEEA